MSKITIACPHCQKSLKVPPAFNGKKAKCPGCQAAIIIRIPQTKLTDSKPRVKESAARAPAPAPVRAKQTTASPKPKFKKKNKGGTSERQQEPNDWSAVGWGVVLIVIAFVSVAMPGMDGMGKGGRGIIRMVAQLLSLLGPYAPLVGILFGLVGVLVAMGGLNRVPSSILKGGAGLVSLLILVLCGTSFLYAMGFLVSDKTRVAQEKMQAESQVFKERVAKQMEAKELKSKRHMAQLEIARRSREGAVFHVFKRNGFLNVDVDLELADSVGEIGKRGRVHYSDEPISGVAFYRKETSCEITLALPDESSEFASSAKPGEAVYGFNLNFKEEGLAGVQVVFGVLDGEEMTASALREGKWLGEPAEEDQCETVTGNGQPVHGFAAFDKHQIDLCGFQIVIRK